MASWTTASAVGAWLGAVLHSVGAAGRLALTIQAVQALTVRTDLTVHRVGTPRALVSVAVLVGFGAVDLSIGPRRLTDLLGADVTHAVRVLKACLGGVALGAELATAIDIRLIAVPDLVGTRHCSAVGVRAVGAQAVVGNPASLTW